MLLFIGAVENLYAQEATGESQSNGINKWLAISASLGIAIAAFGGAFGQAKAIQAALEGTARNPGSADIIRGMLIIGLAFIESLVIYALVISIILVLIKWV
jgi:F-type H+-transporting ATPase subunit c